MTGPVNYDDLVFSDDHLYLFKGVAFSGLARELNEDGSVGSELEFSEGKQHGFARSFFGDGRLKHEIRYRCGLRHGTEKHWYADGKLREHREFRFDVMMESREWSVDGSLTAEFIRAEDDHLYQLVMKKLGSGMVS